MDLNKSIEEEKKMKEENKDEGRKAEEKRKAEEAKLEEEKKLEKNIEKAYLLFNRGCYNLDLEDLLSARNDFTEAISLFKDPDFFYFRGLTYNKLNQYKNALIDFKIGIMEDKNGEKYIFPMKVAEDKIKETKNSEEAKEEKQFEEDIKLEDAKNLVPKHNTNKDVNINKNATKSSYPAIMIGLFFIGLFAPNFSLAILLIVGIIGWLIQQAD